MTAGDRLHNAQAVVRTWREGGGDEPTPFAEPALSMSPSRINRQLATAFRVVGRQADREADGLVQFGLLPGDERVRELRGIASRAANRANVLFEWAAELAEAEAEG